MKPIKKNNEINDIKPLRIRNINTGETSIYIEDVAGSEWEIIYE